MAKKEKKSFIVFQSWEDGFNMLNESEKAQFITNLFLFHRGEDIILNSPMLELFWKSIQYNLKRNVDEYDFRSQTSAENGKNGGAPKGNSNAKKQPKNNLNQPNQPNEELGSTYSTKNNPNDNDNDNDNGNVNGNDDENENVNVNVNDKYIAEKLDTLTKRKVKGEYISFEIFQKEFYELNLSSGELFDLFQLI